MPLHQVDRHRQKPLKQSMPTHFNTDKQQGNEGLRSIYPALARQHYGSLEEEEEQRVEAKQRQGEQQMRQLELEYQQHQRDRQHCRRHNISAYNYYAQSEFAFQSAAPLSDHHNSINYSSGPIRMIEKFLNIRWIGAAFFVAASIFCLYEIWVLSNEKPPIITSKLLMVNIFTRHGDRRFIHYSLFI